MVLPSHPGASPEAKVNIRPLAADVLCVNLMVSYYGAVDALAEEWPMKDVEAAISLDEPQAVFDSWMSNGETHYVKPGTARLILVGYEQLMESESPISVTEGKERNLDCESIGERIASAQTQWISVRACL